MMMAALILFASLGSGSVIEYDHGYFPGRVTGRLEPLPYVPMIDKFTVAGTYKTFDGKDALILDRGGKGTYEIMTFDNFLKRAKVIEFKPRKGPLPVFDDSDLSVTIQRWK